jgi:hypothetical protein
LSADAEWCGQCYLPRGRASTAPGALPPGSIMAPTRQAAKATLPKHMTKTRWRKTQTTFGPVGRVLATMALVIPFLFFVAIGILSGGMFVGGALIWGILLMPWGLRDVWKAGQVTSG